MLQALAMVAAGLTISLMARLLRSFYEQIDLLEPGGPGMAAGSSEDRQVGVPTWVAGMETLAYLVVLTGTGVLAFWV